MIGLAAGADLGVFDLDKIADVNFAVHHGAGPEPGKRYDAAILRHHRAVDHAIRENLGALADARIRNDAIGSHSHACGEMHIADEHGVDVDEDIAAHLHVAAN